MAEIGMVLFDCEFCTPDFKIVKEYWDLRHRETFPDSTFSPHQVLVQHTDGFSFPVARKYQVKYAEDKQTREMRLGSFRVHSIDSRGYIKL